MWSKDFDGWNEVRKQLHESQRAVSFNERDVWWCSIGVNIGTEQDGHNIRYERPVLILKGYSPQLFLGVPISTTIKPGRSYYVFWHGDRQFSAVLSQIRSLSAKRLTRKLYSMNGQDFEQIQLAIVRQIALGGQKRTPPAGESSEPEGIVALADSVIKSFTANYGPP